MRKQFLIVLIAALSTLVACKKEKEETKPSGSSKVLKRMIETENGTTTTHVFSYDNNKRLTSIRSTDNAELIALTYDGNGNIIKIEIKEGDVKSVFDFTYTNGLPVSGSFKSFEQAGTPQEELSESYNLTYTVENGLVAKMKVVVPADPVTQQQGYEINYDLTYNNGNVTKIEAAGMSSYKASFTYGDKKPVFPTVAKYILDPGGFTMLFFARNEILSTTYDFPGTEMDATVRNEYTYDAQGYVLTANDGEKQTKFEYE